MLSIRNRLSDRRLVLSYALTLFLILPLISSCQLVRVIRYNFADITDYAIFPNRPLQPSAQPFRFHQTEKPRYAQTFTDSLGETYNLDDHLHESDTVALLIVHNDTVQYERYLDGYEAASTVASFSMAKSIFSLLFGIAVDRARELLHRRGALRGVKRLLLALRNESRVRDLCKSRVGRGVGGPKGPWIER